MKAPGGVRRPSFGDVTAPVPLYLPVSFLVVGLVTFAAVVILTIGARSPYTHANLGAGPDSGYERTRQTFVGDDSDFAGVSADARVAGTDALTRGAALYVTAGCAGCHALGGRGGVVGPRLAGIDAQEVATRVRQGPVGMPRFSATGLTEDDVAAIAAYLGSLRVD